MANNSAKKNLYQNFRILYNTELINLQRLDRTELI